MSEFINVLIAFDASSIAERYPDASKDPESPTQVDQSLIYMTTRQDHVIGTSGAELNFRANPRDIIRWRETTLSLNSEYSALLYRYVSYDPLISKPRVVISDGTYPLPKEGATDQPDFGTQDYEDHYWEADVNKVGQVTYHFYFQLLDSGQELVGYFQWDPFITIEKRS
ncbi:MULTISPECIES: inclusion body family protein [Streptomyces]|uniref:Nematocidal protein AidA n=1 Tax=Streptomyces malaysiensis TaxID=92644 RepID=A0A7X6AUV3_STRMQ|nr:MULTISPECIES: inclusion body family protein [Streptomyces]MYU11942.1 nematocidal protein AidA [Streptomyces sp. SID8361]AUA15443.1 Inclusion body protein [Streptomyces sp. M56]MYX61953.1 nematocidal protein AidA [Streptomyces sp. SID8382]NIY63654.1 nematocidal protein AidA [Streptomyces malaysiensis]SCF86587.1 Inclusion body protein [Streptomyces sp. MnatMP-M27]